MQEKILDIGSFFLFESKIPTGSFYYEVKYRPEHFPIAVFPFLNKEDAIIFAEQKTKSDKRLFK